MKFYNRYPDRALAGMAALNPGQRGIYNSVIDLLYSCDGIVPAVTPADDYRIAKSISVAPQTWRKFKKELMALRKIRLTTDGRLEANGVNEERNRAETYSDTQRKRASKRWLNYRLSKTFNGDGIPERQCLPDRDIYTSSTSLEALQAVGDNCGQEVAEESDDNFGVVKPRHPIRDALEASDDPKAENKTLAPGAEYHSRPLAAVMKAKGWI